MFVKHGRGIKVNDLYIDGAVKTYGFRPKKDYTIQYIALKDTQKLMYLSTYWIVL